MSRPSQYRCERDVVKLLEKTNLSVNALRLVHATYHHLDNHPGWTPPVMAMPPTANDDRICTVLCAELCATAGTPGANDISMVREGVRDLDHTGLFQHIEIVGRKLRFRFSSQLARAAQQVKNGRFVMLDCDFIARLRTVPQMQFYTRAEMVTRQNYPSFYLPAQCVALEPWCTTKRTWLAAAARVGELLDQEYLFIPELDAKREKVIQVRVKISHSATRWSRGKLYPRYTFTPVSLVACGQARTLTRCELTLRREWTSVSGPKKGARLAA